VNFHLTEFMDWNS